MYPVLFKIPIFGGLTISTYGALVAFGFLMGILYVTHEAKRIGEDVGIVMDLVFWLIVSAIIGSRVYYVLVVEPSAVLKDPLVLFKIWYGGLVFQGGVIGALLVGVYWVKRHKLPLWKYMDLFAPAIPLGHFFGRIGCVMAGCCSGREAPHAGWYTLVFPADPASFAPPGIPLYPAQLMDGVSELAIFFGLVIFKRWKKFNGQLMAIYMIAYAIVRFVVEFFREPGSRNMIYGWFSAAQMVSLLMVVFALWIWIRNSKKERLEEKI